MIGDYACVRDLYRHARIEQIQPPRELGHGANTITNTPPPHLCRNSVARVAMQATLVSKSLDKHIRAQVWHYNFSVKVLTSSYDLSRIVCFPVTNFSSTLCCELCPNVIKYVECAPVRY